MPAAPSPDRQPDATGPDPVEDDLDARVATLDLTTKVALLTGADNWHTHACPAAGLASMLLSDGPVGVRGATWDERDPSANLPSPTAMAASFDPDHVARLGWLLAGEARRKGAHSLLGPTINLQRTPVGGRHFECFSEDPLLTAALAVGYVAGVQRGGVAATPKHVVGNDSETDRFEVDVRMSTRALHEVYLAPFEAAVLDAGAWMVMAAYNRLGGTTLTEHPVLREVLQQRWGFDGVTVSDWYATHSLEPAANAALDLVMPGPGGPWGDRLVAGVREGRVPEEIVDDKVRRLLRLAARTGALGSPAGSTQGLDVPGPGQPPGPPPDDAGMRATLRDAAARGMVLLTNDGLLPFATDGLRSVAVVGPNAEVGRPQGGGSAGVRTPHLVGPLAGLRDALGADVEVRHAVGARTRRTLEPIGERIAHLPEGDATGLRVRFLDADGQLLATQDRRDGTLTWMGGFDLAGIDDAQVHTIEVRARLRPDRAGRWQIGVAGVGPTTLDLDSERVLDEELPLPEGDMVELLVRPPEARAERDVGPDDEIELVCRNTVLAPVGAIMRLGAQPVLAPDDELAEAERTAADADLAVVVVGTNEEVESEGFDRDTLALPGRQDELVRRVVAANPRTIVVVNAGAPVLLPWIDQVPATLVTWFGGQEFGAALAEVLTGEAEPSGRLPVTWPAGESADEVLDPTPDDGRLDYDEGIHVGHRRWLRDGSSPAFWFGHGLGYTEWTYEDAQVAHPEADGTGGTVRVRLRNTGQRPGREVVQVYLSRPGSSVERPVRWLAGCTSVLVPPGASTEAEVAIWPRALRHLADAGQTWGDITWALEAGDYDVSVGRSVADLRLHATLTLS